MRTRTCALGTTRGSPIFEDDITPGAVTEGPITEGALTPGATTEGAITSGDVTPGVVTPTGPAHLYVNGVAPTRNLSGISFAVANVTGLLARLLETEPALRRIADIERRLA